MQFIRSHALPTKRMVIRNIFTQDLLHVNVYSVNVIHTIMQLILLLRQGEDIGYTGFLLPFQTLRRHTM